MYKCEVIVFAAVALAASVAADGAHGHGHHAAHAPAPAPVQQQQEYVYSAPAEPAVESYQGYAAESPAGFDMTTLIIPFIVLIGLFLLFPTYITLDDVRRKRSVGEGEEEIEGGLMQSFTDKIQDIYGALIESEECMERIACQIGAIAKDAGLSSSMSAGALLMTPAKYQKYAKHFFRAEKCEKIKCHPRF